MVHADGSERANRSEPADPLAEVERDERRQLRVCGEQAHGVNLDLGAGLLNGLSSVDPADMTVARFFVLGRCRPRTNWADVATMPMRRSCTASAGRRSLGE